jgi:hypothetical protein
MRVSLLLLALALMAGGLRGAEKCRPEHLTPVDPYPGDWHVRYTDLVQKHLEPPYRFFAAMVVRPSFEGEYSMILHGTKEDYELDWEKTPKFFVSCFAAEKNIWYSMPENNEEKEQKEIKVTTSTAEIAKPLARRVHALWKTMLQRTRYFEDASIYLDGTTFEFSAGGMYGQSRLQCPSPTLLADVGHSLIEFSQAPAAERATAEVAVEKAALALEKYLKAHPFK